MEPVAEPHVESLRKRLMQKAREDVAVALSAEDLRIAKTASLIEDLDVISNALGEQAASSAKTVPSDELDRVQSIVQSAQQTRASLMESLEAQMKSYCPNFSIIATPLIGAKMLREAGSLKRLAMLPSSTIQLLGAKKALFRHLKSKTPPPKHGFLVAHPKLSSLRPWMKGSAARLIAGKASIAARADYFGKRDISQQLLQEIDAGLKHVLQKAARAPKPLPQQLSFPKHAKGKFFKKKKQ